MTASKYLILATTLVAGLATAQTPLFQAGQWSFATEVRLQGFDGNTQKKLANATMELCYTEAFVKANPHFSDNYGQYTKDLGSKVKSCQFWPISREVGKNRAQRQLRFECLTTGDDQMWGSVRIAGTPVSFVTSMRVYKNGGTGMVEMDINARFRKPECDREVSVVDAPKAAEGGGNADAIKEMAIHTVRFGDQDYFFNYVEHDGGIVHNNYYRIDDSRYRWSQELSISYYPEPSKTAVMLPVLKESFGKKELYPGTKIVETYLKPDKSETQSELYLRESTFDDQPGFMYEIARNVKEEGLPGIKVYRMRILLPGKPEQHKAALAKLKADGQRDLGSLHLAVIDEDGLNLSPATGNIKPITFDGKTFAFDQSTVAVTHIFNGYAPEGSGADSSDESLWVNFYPQTKSPEEVMEWTREQFADSLVKGSKFETLQTTADGKPATLMYLLKDEDDPKLINLSICRYVEEEGGVKAYRFHKTLRGGLAGNSAYIRANMQKWATALGQLKVPIINAEIASPHDR